jgi:hypothetical protein
MLLNELGKCQNFVNSFGIAFASFFAPCLQYRYMKEFKQWKP